MLKSGLLVFLIHFYCSAFASDFLIKADNKTQFHSGHFYIVQQSGHHNKNATKSIVFNCREKIKDIMCLVAPATAKQGSQERECLAGGQEYAKFFEELYDNYPSALKKVFCSLNVIYVEKQFYGTAYAGAIEDEVGNTKGAMMGIRKSVLDENLNLRQWASWKEQLSFGGVQDEYRVKPELQKISTYTDRPVNDFLYFVVAHEFGHIFDFANKLNQYFCDKKIGCGIPTKGSWTEISWKHFQDVVENDDFHLRKDLCFYDCKNKFIEQTEISQLYNELHSTSFISTYAATGPWDDFAESLAYFAINKYLQADYIIQYENEAFDIIEKLKSPVFKRKLDYIEDFINKPDIRYP